MTLIPTHTHIFYNGIHININIDMEKQFIGTQFKFKVNNANTAQWNSSFDTHVDNCKYSPITILL